MADTGMHYGSFIPDEVVTGWVNTIDNYEKNYYTKLFARNTLPRRDVGATVDIDAITYYDTDSGRGQIVAKGSVPQPFTARAKTAKWDMLQIMEGFTVNERDLAKAEGAMMKSKEIDIALDRIHSEEDYVLMNGDSSLGLKGIVGAARANSNGKITTSTNQGAWAGSDDTRDPYEDINMASAKMDPRYSPAFLVGSRLSLTYLNNKNSEEVPFWKDTAALFGKPDTDRSWMVPCQHCPEGYVYLVPYSPKAAEFVVSEDLMVADDYAKQPGGNFWVEIREWVNPAEIHENDAFVEIAIG
jgi:hypothetical protein